MINSRYQTNILLHYTWETRKESPVLRDVNMRRMLCDSLYALGKECGINIISVGGHTDHLHMIVEMTKTQKAAKIAFSLQAYTRDLFRKEYGLDIDWHDGFSVCSIARPQLGELSEYIQQQDKVHSIKSYAQEREEILLQYY